MGKEKPKADFFPLRFMTSRKAIDAAKTTYAKRSRKSGTCWPL